MARTNIVKCKTKEEKQEIAAAWEWQNTLSKKKFAEGYGISTRTLNRILDEMSCIIEEEIDWDYVVTKNEITLCRNGEFRTVSKGFYKFKYCKQTLLSEDFSNEACEEVFDLINTKKVIEKFSEGNITVDHENNTIHYRTFEIKHSLVEHIFKKLENGEDVISIVRFIDKLMDNPDKNIIDQLHSFLKHNDIEIDDKGMIIAYRNVTLDYKDHYTKTMDNKVGTVVKMPRTLVDCNPENTCSEGLHCASIEYASSFGGGRLMKVEINPKNVCSVPVDYNGQKMRVCELTVLEEVNK